LGVRDRLWDGKRKQFPIDDSSCSVVRNSNKCIVCGRCYRVCAEVQGIYNHSQHGRGFYTIVTPANMANMDDSVCIQCGQCINVCPVAAFLEKWSTSQVWKALANPDLHVVVQTAPSGKRYTDAVITTRELIWMIKSYGIHFDRLSDGQFDEPFGTTSGAGTIFGYTGGVMEASLRTYAEILTGHQESGDRRQEPGRLFRTQNFVAAYSAELHPSHSVS
jgi:iron only hydrogenase large subunit-like protein